ALLLVGLAWQILRAQSYRLIQGKTEAEWIKSITYRGESAETDQWRALGPQGIEMLVKALNAGNGPLESRYARIWPSLPDFLRHWLPVPVNSYSTRMCAINMLERLGPDAKSAIPEMVKALKREKTSGVRLSIIDCFSYERGLLRGRDREKNELLPEFIAAMQSPEWALRNNAALALAEYPERADVVVPVLMKTLNDSSVEVRMMAAKALHLVAPQTAAKPEVVEVIIGILKNPNDQIAYQAAQLLGDIGNAASAAIPALTESIHGTNRLVASTAERALKKIDPQAAAKAGVK
ncbi:HEAT repeat domain-containing protein, partial [Pedosphaera parvula]